MQFTEPSNEATTTTIKYAQTEAAKIGGSVCVHESHITLFNVNGDIVGYYIPRQDHITVYLTFEPYKK